MALEEPADELRRLSSSRSPQVQGVEPGADSSLEAQREALASLPRRVGWLSDLPEVFGSISPEQARDLAERFCQGIELQAAA